MFSLTIINYFQTDFFFFFIEQSVKVKGKGNDLKKEVINCPREIIWRQTQSSGISPLTTGLDGILKYNFNLF